MAVLRPRLNPPPTPPPHTQAVERNVVHLYHAVRRQLIFTFSLA